MRNTNTIALERGTLGSIKKSKTGWRRKAILPILLLLILAAAGGGYWYWTKAQAQKTSAAAAASASAKTTTVKTGDLTLSASGSGTLIASQQSSLSFASAGTVASVNVQAGDQVSKGQVLAQLSDLESLKTTINLAEQNLISAQASLAALQQNAASNLANAQLAVATAQKALTDANSALVQKGAARCEQAEIDRDYQAYLLAQNSLNQISSKSDGSNDYYLTYVVPAKNTAARAYSTYVWCSGFTDYEVNSSHAKAAIAQANLANAQSTLASLEKNNGLDPIELAKAENTVDNAQVALDTAKKTLAGATITAPYDGVILSVAGVAGDTVGTGAFISIADLSHPQVKFYVDETDMSKLKLGQTAEITFDAITGRTFSGKVTQINPVLQTVNSYQVVQGLINLDLSAEKDMPSLASGMNAAVQVISGQAKNALLVPLAALRDLGDGTYSVFVVGANGKTSMKVVEVGLQDAASAEIKSGLSAGDVVTTGIVQTK